MNGQLRHLLNGSVITDEPGGWPDFTEEIERNLDERIIHLKYPNTLVFVGDGYFTLRQQYLDGICNEVGYACEQYWNGGWQRVCEGVIYISDIVWNLSKGTADTAITDTTVGARILNNKQVKVFPTAALSKNGEAITPVPPIALEVFDPAATEATYIAEERIAYDWGLCMAHLLSAISDNEVGFASDWYDSLPDTERFALINGVNLRTALADTRPSEYSLQDLWAFAWKSDNLMAGIEQTVNGPVFRVETDAYWKGAPSGVVMLSQEDLEQSIDTDALYAAVKMGSEGAIKNEAIEPEYSLPYVGLRTFTEETYNLKGQCNTDNVLDIFLPFIVCSNAIEDAVVNDDDGNDEEVFVIQYDRTTSKAVKSDYLTNNGAPWLYNERFLNINVVNRWSLPADGVSYFADVDAAFRAEGTGTTGPFSDDFTTGHTLGQTTPTYQTQARHQFDNDYTAPNFDPSNQWGNGTTQGNPVSNADSRYTAPAQGLYAFEVGQVLNVNQYSVTGSVGGVTVNRAWVLPYVVFKHFNSANVLQGSWTHGTATSGVSVESEFPAIDGVGSVTNVCTQEVYMQAGDYLEVWFDIGTWISLQANGGGFVTQTPQVNIGPFVNVQHFIEYTLSPGSWVRTTYVATFGGSITAADPDGYFSTKLEFSRHIDNQQWAGLRGNFALSVDVGEDETTPRRGYIRAASRKIASGETDWELTANRDQTNV